VNRTRYSHPPLLCISYALKCRKLHKQIVCLTPPNLTSKPGKTNIYIFIILEKNRILLKGPRQVRNTFYKLQILVFGTKTSVRGIILFQSIYPRIYNKTRLY